jgi:hypothetical protein
MRNKVLFWNSCLEPQSNNLGEREKGRKKGGRGVGRERERERERKSVCVDTY